MRCLKCNHTQTWVVKLADILRLASAPAGRLLFFLMLGFKPAFMLTADVEWSTRCNSDPHRSLKPDPLLPVLPLMRWFHVTTGQFGTGASGSLSVIHSAVKKKKKKRGNIFCLWYAIAFWYLSIIAWVKSLKCSTLEQMILKCASKTLFWVSTLWSLVNATYNLAVISIFAFKYLLNITTQNATCILCNQMVFIHVIPNTHFAPSMAWPGIPVDFFLSELINLTLSFSRPSWIAELLGMWYLEGWLCHSDATLMSKKKTGPRG